MNNPCLLVIDNDSPLNLALEMLLAPRSSILAVKSRANDFKGVIDEICNLRSQVVIIEDVVMLADDISVSDMLSLNPNLKIVVVSSESNYIHIFRKDEVLIQHASKFLEIIQTK